VGRVRSNERESYGGGSLTNVRVHYDGQVEGDEPNQKGPALTGKKKKLCKRKGSMALKIKGYGIHEDT